MERKRIYSGNHENMNTKELEEKLEGQAESQNIEFKCAIPWHVKSFARALLALANVRDGGFIIVGIKDGTLERQGVANAIKATYKIDEMKDQMNSFADPHVDFSVYFPKDKSGLDFVIMRVFQFEEIPVICIKSHEEAGTQAGRLYYRNKNKRVESAPVSNSYDMRSIVDMATVKMMQRKGEIGYTVKTLGKSVQKQLDEELEGL